jgi:hypothetical protein
MHQYEARALKLKPRNAVPTTVRKETRPDHEVKTLKAEYVWPGRRAPVYPTEYKPKPHNREVEMQVYRSIRSKINGDAND